ncbi:LptA/OstA family protein [Vampirovibrio sp.]|uniref:LptA/OstA family protein n=1 Tax=Vampirovibrio sp. TaxID=2717857 RepID=UPI0035933CA9
MSRSVFKRLALMALLAMFSQVVLASAATSAITPDPSNIRMTADKQSYNLPEKKYILSGHVTVAFQDMRITGNKAEVDMDAAGKPQVANFYNRPTFKRIKPNVGEDNIVGDVIKVYLAEDRYGALGNVVSHIATVAAAPFLIRSDAQEFDNKNKVVSASGNVKVDYKGSRAFSSIANVRMKPDGKADRVIFSGGAKIEQENSVINGDRITVMVDSGNLIAENHVTTNVNLKESPSPIAKPTTTPASAKPTKVIITSDYQQYDKSSDVMMASGNVKILYDDYVAVGPKATFKLKGNDLDRIFLTGRPTITEPGRVITADKITITTNPKNFDAVGNVKVNFKTENKGAQQPAATPAKGPATGAKALPSDEASDY